MKVVAGTSSLQLGKKLAMELGVSLADVIIKRYPDGECYVRILEDVENEEVILVGNSHPDAHTIELFLLQDALRTCGVKKITTIIPYFGYARADKIFNPGEVIGARSMVKRLELTTDEVLLVDIHEPKIQTWWNCPTESVSAMPLLGKALGERGVTLIVAPDQGAIDLARMAARAAGVGHSHIVKKRLDAHTVKMDLDNLAVKGQCVGLVDDIISTGNTIKKAARKIFERGARKVWVACTHGLCTPENVEMLLEETTGLFISDSLVSNPGPGATASSNASASSSATIISLVPVLAEALLRK